jgi:hypothetical protein
MTDCLIHPRHLCGSRVSLCLSSRMHNVLIRQNTPFPAEIPVMKLEIDFS